MGQVIAFPGVDLLTKVKGTPRPDIADALRVLADRADQGDIESMVLIAIGPEYFADLLSTPETNFFEMMGAIEALKPQIIERREIDTRSRTDFNPTPEPA